MEFDWDDMVAEAVLKVKEGKAFDLSEIVVEMVKAGGGAMLAVIMDLISLIIKEEQIRDGWDQATIINCFKRKGDTTRYGNYQGLKLLEHTMRVLERIVDVIIRQ